MELYDGEIYVEAEILENLYINLKLRVLISGVINSTWPFLGLCYNQTGNISTLDGTSLKLVDKFTYLGSSVSSTEKDIDTRLTKAWTAIDPIYQPLRSGRIWHKVNFLSGVQQVWIQSCPSPRLVA